MPLILAALLSISTGADAQQTFALPPVPEDLPLARSAPVEGTWIDLGGRDGGEGVWLPRALAADVHMRLEFLDRTPEMCAERLVWAKKRCEVDVRSAVDVALADAGIERVAIEAKPSGWPTWQVVLVSVGSVVVGAALGGAAVVIAR